MTTYPNQDNIGIWLGENFGPANRIRLDQPKDGAVL